MKSLQSETLALFRYSVYGGTLAEDLDYQQLSSFCGTIIIDVPLTALIESKPDTLYFEQQPRLYYNLGSCRHYKVSGTVYRPTSGGPITPSERVSLFGETFNQDGIGQDILSRSTDGAEYYVSRYGNYNRCKWGTWVFGFGALRDSQRVYVALGGADLINDQRYLGTYDVYCYEFRRNGKRVDVRYCMITVQDGTRTQDISPLAAIKRYRELVDTKLDTAVWRQWKMVYSTSSISLEEIKLPSWDQVFPPTDRYVRWGELASDAYNSVPFFSSNGVAYGLDLLSLRRDALQTLELIQSFGTTGKLAKQSANLFLSFYYGWRLLAADTQELFDAYEKAAHSRNFLNRATSRRSWSAHGATYLAVLQCYYHRYARLSRVDQFILQNDLALTPENLWDLVPFSFVVDWFTGIGQVLEDLSNYYTFMQAHEVVCTGRSIKATKRISASLLGPGLAGELTISYYNRDYVSHAIDPTFRFSNSVNPLDHFIEGSALIVSKR